MWDFLGMDDAVTAHDFDAIKILHHTAFVVYSVASTCILIFLEVDVDDVNRSAL
jgi:hypothetical protein